MVKYHLISISKIFFTNKSDGIFILLPGSCPRGGTLGRWVAQVAKIYFFKHGHVTYQIDKDNEQNRMKAKFSS